MFFLLYLNALLSCNHVFLRYGFFIYHKIYVILWIDMIYVIFILNSVFLESVVDIMLPCVGSNLLPSPTPPKI